MQMFVLVGHVYTIEVKDVGEKSDPTVIELNAFCKICGAKHAGYLSVLEHNCNWNCPSPFGQNEIISHFSSPMTAKIISVCLSGKDPKDPLFVNFYPFDCLLIFQ